MREDILTPEQKSALALLKQHPEISGFYLAGGTALALLIGHRYSEDFDMFSAKEFDADILLDALQKLGSCLNIRKNPGMLHLSFNSILCSFIGYKYQLLDVPTVSPWGFGIATIRDIGAMMILAIGGRGRRRDFIDLHFICRALPLEKLWRDFEVKYANTGYDPYHFLRALSYFKDAEADPMPRMLVPADWNNIKKFFEQEIKKLAP